MFTKPIRYSYLIVRDISLKSKHENYIQDTIIEEFGITWLLQILEVKILTYILSLILGRFV